MSLAFKQDNTIVFVGDSITDAGRTNHLPPYGGGYVSMLRNILLAKHPELNLNLINSGLCGNTLEGLELRWDKDVLDYKPDHLFILVGINDAAMQLESHRANATVLKEFAERYHKLIQISTFKGINNITLLTPFYISNDKKSALLNLCLEYGNIVKDLATEFNLNIIDLQSMFNKILKISKPDFWSGDGIHPHPHGHYLIAEKLYEEMV